MSWPQRANAARTKPIPRDWADVARCCTVTEAAHLLGVSDTVIRRWERESKIECKAHQRTSLMPEWFPERAPTGSAAHWAHMLGVTENCLRRWAREHGTHCKRRKTGFPKGTKVHRGNWEAA